MTRKNKTSVPPVTDIKQEKPAPPEEVKAAPVEYVEPEVTVTEPPVKTPEQRIDEIETFLNRLLERLTPVIQLSDQIAQQQQQAKENPQAAQPQGLNEPPAWLMQILGAGGGSGDTELAQLGNQYGKLVLKQAIENIGKPSIQERIGDAVLERFIGKKAGDAAKDLE